MLRVDRDARTRHEQRYRIYKVRKGKPVCIAATPRLSWLGGVLEKLREEGQITNDSKVGIKDDVERKWIINPFGKGE